MDHQRFASLLRSLAARQSRRDALRLLAAATFGGLLTVSTISTEAKSRRGGKRKGKHKKRRNGNVSGTPRTTSPPPGPTCTDGVTNGNETDLDCGGGTCPRCAAGKTCASRDDCASARCDAGACEQCANALTDCGTDIDGSQCACRDHESGQRYCTKINGTPYPAGTPCTVCQGGEQCFPVNGGASGIECILPCGA